MLVVVNADGQLLQAAGASPEVIERVLNVAQHAGPLVVLPKR